MMLEFVAGAVLHHTGPRWGLSRRCCSRPPGSPSRPSRRPGFRSSAAPAHPDGCRPGAPAVGALGVPAVLLERRRSPGPPPIPMACALGGGRRLVVQRLPGPALRHHRAEAGELAGRANGVGGGAARCCAHLVLREPPLDRAPGHRLASGAGGRGRRRRRGGPGSSAGGAHVAMGRRRYCCRSASSGTAGAPIATPLANVQIGSPASSVTALPRPGALPSASLP